MNIEQPRWRELSEIEVGLSLLLLVIKFMADLLQKKYRGSVVIMVGRGGAYIFVVGRP